MRSAIEAGLMLVVEAATLFMRPVLKLASPAPMTSVSRISSIFTEGVGRTRKLAWTFHQRTTTPDRSRTPLSISEKALGHGFAPRTASSHRLPGMQKGQSRKLCPNFFQLPSP